MTMQLSGAYSLQKVEWGMSEILYFDNPLGRELLEKKVDSAWWESIIHIKDYLKVAIPNWEYTVAFAIKGLFNGIDICYDSIIVQDFSKGKMLHMFVNYSLIYIAVLKILSIAKQGGYKKYFYFFLLSVNVLPYTLGMVEVRFSMPLLVSVYGIAILGEERIFQEHNRAEKACCVTMYMIYLCVCLYLHMDTWANIR